MATDHTERFNIHRVLNRTPLRVSPSDTSSLARVLIGLALEDNPGGVVLFSTSHPERITEMVQKPFAVEILRPAREDIAKMPLSGSSPACDSNEIVRFKITMRRSLPGHEGPARPIRRRAENPLHLQLNVLCGWLPLCKG